MRDIGTSKRSGAWPTWCAFLVGVAALCQAQGSSYHPVGGACLASQAEVRDAHLWVVDVTRPGGLMAQQAVPLAGGQVRCWRAVGAGNTRWWTVGAAWRLSVGVAEDRGRVLVTMGRVLPGDAAALEIEPGTMPWQTDGETFRRLLACQYDQSMWPFHSARSKGRASQADTASDAARTSAAFVIDGNTLDVWRRDMLVDKERGQAPAPGRWRQRDTMAWPNTQPFRVLPTTQHWYFLTADGKLWHTPRQGEPNREIKEVWAAGERKILGTIIDHDLNRSFVFGDGWYLDLGDELRTVTEPADQPWPRPAADAPEIERLRVWRGWVPTEPAPAVGAGG